MTTRRRRGAARGRSRREAATVSQPPDLQADHTPVLLAEVVAGLAVVAGGRYVDGTLGLGGHAAAVLAASGPDGLLLGIDADPEARTLAARRLEAFGDRVRIVGENARQIERICREVGWDAVDGVVLDLGISSMQLGSPGRGFSFQQDGPLDMRMDPTSGLTAGGIVNIWPSEEIARVIWEYGEEPRSRRVARAILAARPLSSTTELASVVARALGSGGRTHPATRTFQALRIAVNDELGALADALAGAVAVLRPGGRLAVISFHSGEDRIVKEFLRRESRDCLCAPQVPICRCGHQARVRLVNRRVITPSEAELRQNPRSRSARLRVAERLAIQP